MQCLGIDNKTTWRGCLLGFKRSGIFRISRAEDWPVWLWIADGRVVTLIKSKSCTEKVIEFSQDVHVAAFDLCVVGVIHPEHGRIEDGPNEWNPVYTQSRISFNGERLLWNGDVLAGVWTSMYLLLTHPKYSIGYALLRFTDANLKNLNEFVWMQNGDLTGSSSVSNSTFVIDPSILMNPTPHPLAA